MSGTATKDQPGSPATLRGQVFSTALLAAMVLVPYTGLLLPFRPGMVVQLGLLVALLALAWWSGSAFGPAALPGPPRAVTAGLALYGGAAIWGMAVGLASGNPIRHVASQTIAFLLLPLAAWAFLRTPGHGAESVAWGLGAAAVLACALHLTIASFPALRTTLMEGNLRFFLRNDAHAMGAITLLFLVTVSRWTVRRSLGSGVALVAATILLLGSQTRGAWISSFGGLILVLVLLIPSRRRLLMILASLAVGLLTAAASGWFVAHLAARQSTILFDLGATQAAPPGGAVRVFEPSPRQGTSVVLATGLRLTAPAVELDATARVPEGQSAATVVFFFDATGTMLGKRIASIPAAGKEVTIHRILAVPSGTKSMGLLFWADKGSRPVVVSLLRLSTCPSVAGAWLRHTGFRLLSPVQAALGRSRDANLSYRERELAAIYELWRRASPVRLAIGRGLGATFPFRNSSWDAHGRRIQAERSSYIHDFYVLLAFKLGLAGLAALGGLLVIAGWTCRRTLRCHGTDCWFLAGMTAAWAAYLVWSLTSPEIYDFRMAPIWGALVAACVRASQETGGPQPAQSAAATLSRNQR